MGLFSWKMQFHIQSNPNLFVRCPAGYLISIQSAERTSILYALMSTFHVNASRFQIPFSCVASFSIGAHEELGPYSTLFARSIKVFHIDPVVILGNRCDGRFRPELTELILNHLKPDIFLQSRLIVANETWMSSTTFTLPAISNFRRTAATKMGRIKH